MVQVTLNATDFNHPFKHEGRQFDGFTIKHSSNSRLYITCLMRGMRMTTISKQMQLVNGQVLISFGKDNKLVIGTYKQV